MFKHSQADQTCDAIWACIVFCDKGLWGVFDERSEACTLKLVARLRPHPGRQVAAASTSRRFGRTFAPF